MTYSSFVIKFAEYSDEKLIGLLFAEQKKPGWTNTRAMYLLALKQVLSNRGVNQILIVKEETHA